MGMSTENALRGFQEANDLTVTGKLDEATKGALSEWDRIPATRVVTIPAAWGETSYTDMPEDVAEKAKLDRLGYTSLVERLAERFHTTVEVLEQLNPGGKPAGMGGTESTTSASATPTASPTPQASGTGSPSAATASLFATGQQIRVPNIGADRIAPRSVEDSDWQRTLASLGVGSEQPSVDRIVVSKAGKTLKAYQGDKLIALFTVSSGSSEFPLPLGEWDIVGEAYNPPYSYDPEVLGNGNGETYTLAPGPNSPVGIVWIDLSKEHYGIHGTPDPETIGRAQSSGCVRLTNWDAARLAGMVSQSTQVLFEA
jgi:lipoprotein-anchoring transpeptidase ErfK/SrfK